MVVIARRLGFALTLTAAGAAGVVSLARDMRSALRAGCRQIGHTEREVPWWGGGRTLDRHWVSSQSSVTYNRVQFDPETMHVAIFDKGAPPRPLP